jgi:toxin-antitoxin system PIN domain toxin
VIAVDTNLLVYAHREDSDLHQRADACLTELAEGSARWAIPWPCLHEFFAIVTHPRIYRPPTPAAQAMEQIDAWLEAPGLELLGEAPGYWAQLVELLKRSRVAGPAVHDARIAALCLHHGVDELWTADRDFSRFAALRARNPLVG